MKLKIYQVDAFSNKLFSGNPAAVCVLDCWLSDTIMQNIAAENNLAETAFAVKNENQYHIRWFTPEVEVDLCGHATLASAFVLFEFYETAAKTIHFHSPRSGSLIVQKTENGLLTMNFPTDTLSEIPNHQTITKAIGIEPLQTWKGKTDYMLIYPNQTIIEQIKPNFQELAKTDGRGIIVTAEGNETDFVSRFFAPQVGINEDPVTGSAHTSLTPYWAKALNKNKLTAQQLSKRGGNLYCEYLGERVAISGEAVLYLVGEIFI